MLFWWNDDEMYLRDGETAVDVGRLVDVDKATILPYLCGTLVLSVLYTTYNSHVRDE